MQRQADIGKKPLSILSSKTNMGYSKKYCKKQVRLS